MDDIANMKCQHHYLHLEQYFIQKTFIKIADIYVRITIPKINNLFFYINKN